MIMKTINFALISIFLIFYLSDLVGQTTIEVSGDLNQDVVWDADTVKIIGDIFIEENIRLTILPGTYVQAQGYFGIFSVNGIIDAIGTDEDMITFTVKDTVGFKNENWTNKGGWKGIKITNGSEGENTSTFKYCNFHFGKKAEVISNYNQRGGAIYVSDYYKLDIQNCNFTNNYVYTNADDDKAAMGGAIYCTSVKEIVIRNCFFENNVASIYGGAIGLGIKCNVVIDHNSFIYNVGYGFVGSVSSEVYLGAGGAIYSNDPDFLSPIISNNYFYNNKSSNGIIYINNRNSRIFNNVICNNIGSAISDENKFSTSHIYNNTIANNLIYYGVINIFSSDSIYNNIVWNNKPIYGVYSDDIIFENSLPFIPVLMNNCVNNGTGGENGIYSDPLFKHQSDIVGYDPIAPFNDWSLSDVISPCINAGIQDTTGFYIPLFDINNNNRIFGEKIDIGAFENQKMTNLEDIYFKISSIFIYPNPAIDYIDVLYPEEFIPFKIEIYNETGKKNGYSNSSFNTIYVSNFNAGIYILVAQDKNGNYVTGKFIKI